MNTETDTVAALAATYTEAQLRAAYEAAKAHNEAGRRDRWVKECARLKCPECGERARYTARPDSIRYTYEALSWNDERLELHDQCWYGSEFGDDSPGDGENDPGFDDFTAYAWCGTDTCDWFTVGDDTQMGRILDDLIHFRGRDAQRMGGR